MRTAIVDIDGTLADCRHRLHHVLPGRKRDWNAFFGEMDSDEPIWPVAEVVRHLALESRVVLCSGDLLATAGTLPATSEGFVVRFSNGHRIKIKGDEYCRIHRLVSNVSPLAIYENMKAGDDLDAIRRELPEEFWADFDRIRALLAERIHRIVDKTIMKCAELIDLSDKEVGLRLGSFDADIRSFIFPLRKTGDLLTGRSREALFRAIRPTGNQLDGYVPSSSMNRVFEEAA